MRFRLLGPLEVRAGEEWRGIGAPKWRSVLAALLINAGQIVPADVLINEVWRDAPPAKAGNLISIYVLRLRRLMGDADSTLLVTRAPGYQLRIAAGDSDAQLFETLVDEGRRALAAGDPATAASQLAEALALWRGSPLADVPATPLVETAAERLEDLRLDAAELRVTAELDCGNHAQVIPELRRLLADHSLREGLWLLLMRALDGAGRHAEALDAYGQARTAISEELGVDPGPELRQAYASMLAKDTGDAPGSISAGTVAASVKPAEPVTATAAFVAQVPAQLPTDVADFTGRGDQVKHLCDVLAARGADGDSGAVRIALVAGSGGLGKTSLAVHAAHRVRASFPDGQLYVDLLGATAHPLLPADVLARFLRDLGVNGRDIPADEDERAGRYRTVSGRAPDARRARQRAGRRPGQAAAAGHRALRGADHHAQPDAGPGQLPAGRPQRARRRRGAGPVHQGGRRRAGGGRARGHGRAAAGLRRPAAGHQDLRGAAGHAERLDHPDHGWPAPQRAPAAGRAEGGRPGRPGQLPGQLRQPARQRPAGRHRPGRRVPHARPVAWALGLVGGGRGPVRHPGVPGRGRAGGPGGRAPAGVHGLRPVQVP